MKNRYIGIARLCIVCFMFLGISGCTQSQSLLKESNDAAVSQETDGPRMEAEKEEGSSKEETDEKFIYVDVCGAVISPGVYRLKEGSRVYQAVEMAGGFTPDACTDQINRAGILEDGQQLHIYTIEEQEELQKSGLEQGSSEEGKVDLNRADKGMLMTLTGIGETRADAILAYREKQGGFSTIEELMQVEGIKEKTYEKLKNQITVS